MPFPTRRPAFVSYIAGALLLGAALAGCTEDYTGAPEVSPTRHLQPLSATVYKELDEKGMTPADPILIRIYKDESKFEVWKKRARDGRYAFFKSYVICRWSGQLGPKVKEGDRQAPEGFYTITPGQMNPKSSYYLSFNIGYPNSYDRAYGRTGTNLMVHGACSSAGCYSMTDANIAEIYALAREAFNAGQRSFQVQAYPFRMTAENMAKYRSNPNMPFWKNLKEGSDHFEVTRLEPKVAVCGKKYVFDTMTDSAALSAAAPCPQLEVEPDVATAVAAKAKADAVKVAQLAAEGAPEAPLEVRQPDPRKKVVPVLVASTQRPDGPSAAPAANTPAAQPAAAAKPAGVQVAALESSGEPSVLARLFGGESKPAAEQTPTEEKAQAYATAGEEEPFYKRVLNFSWLGGNKQAAPSAQANPTIAAASTGLPALANARAPMQVLQPTSAVAAERAPAAMPVSLPADPATTASVPMPKKAPKVGEAVEPLKPAPVEPVHAAAVPDLPAAAPAPKAAPAPVQASAPPAAPPVPEPVVAANPPPAAATPSAPPSPSRINGAFSAFN